MPTRAEASPLTPNKSTHVNPDPDLLSLEPADGLEPFEKPKFLVLKAEKKAVSTTKVLLQASGPCFSLVFSYRPSSHKSCLVIILCTGLNSALASFHNCISNFGMAKADVWNTTGM